ncbi:MAG TPA: hypothetical protein VIH76_04900 [Candidatus Acidoferrales bacterium]
MRNKLVRIYGQGHLHFVTIGCYRRQALLGRVRTRNLFVAVLGEVRKRYQFRLDPKDRPSHDANHSYFYDAENRLVQVDGTSGNCSTATACYFYDAFGRRVQKTVNGANGDLGIGKAGAAVTGSGGVGGFISSGNGLSGGAFATGAVAAYAGTHSAGIPAPTGTSVFGAFAGAGASVFVTNAGSVQQISGNFSTLNINVGYSYAQLQVSWAQGNGVWMLSVSGPKMGVGYGFSVTTLKTNTVTTKGGC